MECARKACAKDDARMNMRNTPSTRSSDLAVLHGLSVSQNKNGHEHLTMQQ